MKIIASTRPNRPILKNIDAVRLNGAFIMADELDKILHLYAVTPLFFDVPTKRDKVIVSDISLDYVIERLKNRRTENIIAISKVEHKDELINVGNNKLCAKVESLKGVETLETFIEHIDILCIDRGDLIKEVGLFDYFKLETKIINEAKAVGREIVIASDILPTLIMSNKPTVPEIIQLQYYKHLEIDYVILAEETAVGFYPYQAIDTIRRITENV